MPLAKSEKVNGQEENKGPTDLSQHQPLPAGGLGGGQPRLCAPLPAWRWGCADLGEAWAGQRLQLERGTCRPHSVGMLRGDARPKSP